VPAIWSAEEIVRIGEADELRIAVQRPETTLRRWVPIWVVCVGDQVYVRTWYRRDDGWYGPVLQSAEAGIRVPGLEVDVTVRDVGNDMTPELRTGVDTAYREKYGRYGDSTVGRMVTDDAAATTLRLIPARSTQNTENQ
jgi:hypothetical protein